MQYFNQIFFRKVFFNPKDFFQTFKSWTFSLSKASSLNVSITSRILFSAASFSAAEPSILTVHVSGSLLSLKVIVVPVEICMPVIFFPSLPMRRPCWMWVNNTVKTSIWYQIYFMLTLSLVSPWYFKSSGW